ncbi:growth arrest-specific protein 7 [Trachemys scripta elegans]|uniref:growth arrest-specific protein 7 n=1 Tax=Trachemys scripta elegans TaxID=31138 RepID=UPI001553F044|nr:growth arrest-specific protein 7 [Trachemys scripta elegans]
MEDPLGPWQKPRKVTPQPGEDSLNCPLPPGWQSYMSPQGHRYYVNTFTNETTWERPSSVPGTPRSPGSQKSAVPADSALCECAMQAASLQGGGQFEAAGSVQYCRNSELGLVGSTMGRSRFSGSGGLHGYSASVDGHSAQLLDIEGTVAVVSPGSPRVPRRLARESSRTINCVTFPHPDTMQEQQLLKPTEWSYCDYFWADKKDPQGNNTVSGFEILLQKQLKGKQMQKEMAEFVRERIKIEEEYAKNLSKLSQNSLAAQEEGTLGEAWAQLKKSLADEAEVHLKFSSKLQSEVEKPLLNFRENFKKDMKKYDHHIADLRKQLASRYTAVEKARKALTERQKDLEMKTQQLEIKLSNKTEEEIKKARRKSTQAGDDLMRCVDLYNQAQSKWFEEMVTSTLELERLEVERVEMIRQHLCQYTQLRHETDMFNQSTIEPVDQLLQKVEPAKDRELWVQEHKTGDIRPVDMEI